MDTASMLLDQGMPMFSLAGGLGALMIVPHAIPLLLTAGMTAALFLTGLI